jgi:hypothetical protein
MATYTFSQGKVSVEDGLYQPMLKGKKQEMESVVLILLPPSSKNRKRPRQIRRKS